MSSKDKVRKATALRLLNLGFWVASVKLFVHHDFPRIHREIRIIKRPVELLLRDWLIRGVVVRGKVFVCEGIGCLDTLSGVEHKHLFEEIDRYPLSVYQGRSRAGQRTQRISILKLVL